MRELEVYLQAIGVFSKSLRFNHIRILFIFNIHKSLYFIRISLVAAGRKDLKGAETGEESRVVLRSVLDKWTKWCHSLRREQPRKRRNWASECLF